MIEATLPIWHERELPDLQLSDRLIEADDYAPLLHALPSATARDDNGFVEWVNQYRAPLYDELHDERLGAEAWLAHQDVRLEEVADAVGQLTATPKYPSKRVVINEWAAEATDTSAAMQTITPGLRYQSDDLIDGQYNPMLGLITLNKVRGERADRISLIDTLAETLGQAAIGGVIDVQVQYDPPGYRYWHGYQWRFGGEYYGGLIQKAATANIAARARQYLGHVAKGPTDHPLLEPYRRREGYYYETGAAVALDILNQAAGFARDGPGLYAHVWQCAKDGRDGASRQEVQAVLDRATKGRLRLEEIEAVPVASEGMPFELLERVEELCELDVSNRPSAILKAR